MWLRVRRLRVGVTASMRWRVGWARLDGVVSTAHGGYKMVVDSYYNGLQSVSTLYIYSKDYRSQMVFIYADLQSWAGFMTWIVATNMTTMGVVKLHLADFRFNSTHCHPSIIPLIRKINRCDLADPSSESVKIKQLVICIGFTIYVHLHLSYIPVSFRRGSLTWSDRVKHCTYSPHALFLSHRPLTGYYATCTLDLYTKSCGMRFNPR